MAHRDRETLRQVAAGVDARIIGRTAVHTQPDYFGVIAATVWGHGFPGVYSRAEWRAHLLRGIPTLPVGPERLTTEGTVWTR